LEPVRGKVVLPDPPNGEKEYIIAYDYLLPGLPPQVGPIYRRFPELDSLISRQPDTTANALDPTVPAAGNNNDLISTGTVYRNIDITPFGGTDLSGGLRLQLQGKLDNNIRVNGVLSDQNFPLQPEGNTKTLDEIDKVYIEVNHPNFQITAGDIDYVVENGKYFNINRKLMGLKNNFKYRDWSGKAVYAGAAGQFHQLSFKGADGNQGPYFLTSATGNRDIIVMAGSERVWLDGKLMVRGENYDYIIDYSSGELTFTPKHIIYSDSDIFVEYQYSDFQYNQNVMGMMINRAFGGENNLSVAWLKEYNPATPKALGISPSLVDSLSAAGDREALVSGAKVDSTGDYILENGIYVYRPARSDTTMTRYSVTFRNDALSGAYIKKVSPEGRLYFEYVPMELRNNYQDLYSPVRKINSPVSEEVLQVKSTVKLSEKVQLLTELALSNHDRNTLSNLDDSDNQGLAHRVELQARDIRLPYGLGLTYGLNAWGRSKRFNGLQRDRGVLFARNWNITDTSPAKETMISNEVALHIANFGQTSVNWSQYTWNSTVKNRWRGEINGKSRWAPEIRINYSRVNSPEKRFTQATGKVAFLPGAFHPYVAYRAETEEFNRRFEHRTVGFQWGRKQSEAGFGLGKRVDWAENDTTRAGLERLSIGYFGEFNYTGRSPKGWRQEIILRKRINDNFQINRKDNYDLAQIQLNYSAPSRFIQWDLKGKLEKSLTETRAVVYDSVGTGLGSYRYDPGFNEYVADPNGAYIAYTVLTGDRRPTSHLEGVQRLDMNFRKSRFRTLKDFDLQLEYRINYRGKSLRMPDILKPAGEQTGVTRSFWNFRHEIDYNPRFTTRRLRNWVLVTRDLNGYDPRGNELRKSWETGSEWYEPVKNQVQVVSQANLHATDIVSQFSNLRNREVNGWWLETGLKWQIEQEWQLTGTVQHGRDRGTHYLAEYSARFYGIRLEVLRFIGRKGRLQGRVDWNTVTKEPEAGSLPPEAAKGLAVGKSLKVYLQSYMLIGDNLSLNMSMDYLNDARYRDLVTLRGEIRAYF